MNPETSAQPVPRRPSRVGATIKALLRTRITTGILTILPLLVTLWVVRLIFGWMRDASGWAVKAVLLTPAGKPHLEQLHFDFVRWEKIKELGLIPTQEQFFEFMPWHVRWAIAIFSVLLTIFILYVIGLFSANIFGRRFIEWLEQLVDRVPLVKTVYRGLKQILSSFSGDQTQTFQRVALVPFPEASMRAVAFITGTFADSVTGEELCTVFIATTPNPTTGYLQVIRRRDITELNWSVEEAIRCVMSGGILRPSYLTIVPNKDLPADVPPGIGPGTLTGAGDRGPADRSAPRN